MPEQNSVPKVPPVTPASMPQPKTAAMLDKQTKVRLSGLAGLAGLRETLSGFYSANKYYVWASIIGLLIIVTLGYFVFRSPSHSSQGANVVVSIDAPDTAPSGGETLYKIKVDNQDKTTLVGMELEIVYGGGMSYVSSEPNAKNVSGTLFAIPDLLPKQNAVVFVKARLEGNINDAKQLLSRLHYKLNNFNSEFTKEADHTTTLIASDVVLDITGPQSTSSSQLVTYEVNYRNSADRDIQNTRVQLTYPDGFSFAASEPAPDLGQNVWQIGTLTKGQDGKIIIHGSFKSSQPGQQAIFSANLLTLDQNGNYFNQATATFTTELSSLPLLVTQTLTDAFKNNIAKPGDTLVYNLKYQNNSTVGATGVNVVAVLDSPALDLSTIQADGGQVNNNTITWNASSARNLESLNPSESGTLRFTVKVRNPATRDTSTNISIKSSVKIKANEFSTFLPGNDLAVKVSSIASLAGAVDFVSGELPPKVGKSTTYRITFSLRNATNDFSNALLTAYIPLEPGGFDKTSIGIKEAGNVDFDTATGKITWRVGALPAHTGDFSSPRTLSFTVSLNPASAQVGQQVALIKNIVMNASDNFTEQSVQLKTGDLDTGDVPTSGGVNKGTVVN